MGCGMKNKFVGSISKVEVSKTKLAGRSALVIKNKGMIKTYINF
jgi:hypothetical protein